MKRSGSNSCFDSLLHNNHSLNFTMEDFEYEAAEILLELPRLIAESESPILSVKWGVRGKRSSTAASTTSQQPVPVAVVAGSGSSPTTCETETEKETEKEKEKRSKALSPTTPFSFPCIESDEKTKQPCKTKVSLKRKKEEYLKMEEELTESNKILKEEIKKLKSDYNQQQALNLKLKAVMNERMVFYLQMQQPNQQSQHMAQQQPLMNMDQTAHNIEFSPQSLLFVGPPLPLDLNTIPLEEEPAGKRDEETRAMAAAQARQRRIQICRSKANNNNNKLRSPFRR